MRDSLIEEKRCEKSLERRILQRQEREVRGLLCCSFPKDSTMEGPVFIPLLCSCWPGIDSFVSASLGVLVPLYNA